LPGGGAVYKFSSRVKNRLKRMLLPNTFFEDLGFRYIGPVDGHNVNKLSYYIEYAKSLHEPAIVHAVTIKGKGYELSEMHPDEYHGVGAFDLSTGVLHTTSTTYSDVFGSELCALAEKDERIYALTAAMMIGTGLSEFAKRFPKRFCDMGIAEGHAASMAGGMASRGLIPVFAVYSTFLQRSYDMLLHDIAIMGLHVVLAVDRAGLVGADGETHHGVFDVAFLSQVPGMSVFCPASYAELRDMLRYAIYEVKGPVAVRYPRGGEGDYKLSGHAAERLIRNGNDVTIVSYGKMISVALEAAELLEKNHISAEVVKLGRITPLPTDILSASVVKTRRLFVLEDCIKTGCVGERIAAFLAQSGIYLDSTRLFNFGDRFLPQGDENELLRAYGLDAASITEAIRMDIRDSHSA